MTPLTNVEKEQVTDSMLKIQSAKATLEKVDDRKIPDAEAIEECLESAADNLRQALGYKRPPE